MALVTTRTAAAATTAAAASAARGAGPGEVAEGGGGDGSGVAAPEVAEVRRALAVLARHVSRAAQLRASRAEWAGLVSSCQSMVNTASAVQDVAITRLAAIEEEWCEDGTSVQTRRVPGHVALDAPDIVAGALGVSHAHAQRRVAQAVRLVAGAVDEGDGRDGEPGDVGEPGGVEEAAAAAVGSEGVSGLHAVMLAGGLDAYRAGVVLEELEGAPAQVAGAVVSVLVPYLGVETAVQLRRRCRRVLARISPDLLRQRAIRARASCGLRRWVQEPGVGRWEGTFPSEQAAEGWAAVDALARRYVAEGRCERVEAARALALMDLIRGQATIDVQLVVTVPADVVDAVPTDAGASVPVDEVDVATPGAATTHHVAAAVARADRLVTSRLGSTVVRGSATAGQPGVRLTQRASAPGEAAGVGLLPREAASHKAAGGRLLPRESAQGEVGGGLRDGDPARCQVSERGVPSGPDVPYRRDPTEDGCADSVTSTWPLIVGDAAAGVTSDDDLVEVSGPFPGDPVLVGRGWIRSFLREARPSGAGGAGAPRRHRRAPSAVREKCHPMTGALLGSALPERRAYRPDRRLSALVRARDGRCRFPGCSVAARFCDLDHVRPWPAGATSAANLLCLCRRHHRVRQHPGWTVRLHPDARAVWTDPTGRVRTSWPRDLLDVVVLPATAEPAASVDPSAGSARQSSLRGPERADLDGVGESADGPGRRSGSRVEAYLGVLGEHLPTRPSGGPRTLGVRARGHPRVHVLPPEPHRVLRYTRAPHHVPPRGPHRHPRGRGADAGGTVPPPF